MENERGELVDRKRYPVPAHLDMLHFRTPPNLRRKILEA
jgi:hypothetical protein